MTRTVPFTARPPARGLSLQAALRAVGDQLDRQGARRVRVSLDSEGIEVQTTADQQVRRYSWTDLQRHGAVQAQARAERPPRQEGALSWAGWLRVVGAALELQGVSTALIEGVLEPPPAVSTLAVHARGRQLLDLPAIQAYERWAQSRRGHLRRP
jgi:hypothetical protein